MATNLRIKLVRIASWVFTVIVVGAALTLDWPHSAYWLLPGSLFVVIVLRLLAFIISDRFKAFAQKLVERLPILTSFFILLISTSVVVYALGFGLLWSLRASKQHFTETAKGPGPTDTPAKPPNQPVQPPAQPETKHADHTKGPDKKTKRAEGPPVVVQQAPYGNLAARCDGLGTAIIRTTDERLKVQPDPMTNRQEYNDWYRMNDGIYFHGMYMRDIVSIQKELSEVHVDDPRLDELIEKHEDYFTRRQQNVQAAIDHPRMFHLSIEEIREIGLRFKQLATQIPH
jgi:hypothetical protein